MVERIIQSIEYELWLFDETIIPDSVYLNQRITAWFDRYNTLPAPSVIELFNTYGVLSVEIERRSVREVMNQDSNLTI